MTPNYVNCEQPTRNEMNEKIEKKNLNSFFCRREVADCSVRIFSDGGSVQCKQRKKVHTWEWVMWTEFDEENESESKKMQTQTTISSSTTNSCPFINWTVDNGARLQIYTINSECPSVCNRSAQREGSLQEIQSTIPIRIWSNNMKRWKNESFDL